MTWNTARKIPGRAPITLLEIDQDFCRLLNGESHTNLLTYSEQFDHANWTKINCTVTANATIAPDGMLTGHKLDDADSLNEALIAQAVTISTVGTYACSIYVKEGTAAISVFNCYLNGDTETNEYLTWSSKTVTGGTLQYIGDGWYRWTIFVTPSSTGTFAFRFWPTNRGLPSLTGYVYVWGAQLVQGSAPGHYVTTTAASATKTCNAAPGSGEQCYNTIETCQSLADYTKEIRTYKYCSQGSQAPIAYGYLPCIVGEPAISSTRLEPDKGIGARGTVMVTLDDFAHTDRGVDPYVETRNYDPMQAGTYWQRWIARNPYHEGREMRVKTGYINDGFDLQNFRSRTYFVDRIDPPGLIGKLQIKGKDILKFIDDKAAVCPAFSEGKLNAAITAGSTSFVLESGQGAAYPASGVIRIGDEVISYASRSTDTFNSLTRGAYNTTADSHEAGDLVQVCYTLTDHNVVDLIHTLLTDYAGIDGDRYIPYDAGLTTPTGTNDEWDDQQDDWLTSWNLTGIVTEPTGVKTLLSEIGQSCNLGIWWDNVSALVKLRANVPPRADETVRTLTDADNLISGSVKIRARPEMRASRVYVYYEEIDPTEDRKPSNFKMLDGDADLDAESADKYGEAAIRQIYARFFDASNAGEAASLAGRLLSRFNKMPYEIQFSLDAKDADLEVGDLVSLESRAIPHVSGQASGYQLQIIEAQEVKPGHLWTYKGLTSRYSGRYGVIGPNTLTTYDAESAANRAAYAFVCYNTGLFTSDGEPAYRII